MKSHFWPVGCGGQLALMPSSKLFCRQIRSFHVPRLLRMSLVLPLTVVAALVVLALATQVGVIVLQHRFPAQGRAVEVDGATLNVLEIGPKDAAGPPIVLIHGASSNLEAMRRPLGARVSAPPPANLRPR